MLSEIAWRCRHLMRRLLPFLAPRITRLRQHPPRPLRLPSARQVAAANCPTFSLVTPSYMQGPFIERTIRSVLDQRYPSLEYVVMDGGSTDATRDVLRSYGRLLTRCVSAPDAGQADAINKGFEGTTGDIMGYLNSDDLLLPGSLAAISEYFRLRPQVDVVYGHRIIVDEQDREIGRWILPEHDPGVLKWMDWVPQETLYWRRRAWQCVGAKLDVGLKFAVDWDLLLRFEQAGLVVERMDRFLGAFRVHPGQKTTATMVDQGTNEMRLLRRRSFGRDVSEAEIRAAVWRYILKHVLVDMKWRLGWSDLET